MRLDLDPAISYDVASVGSLGDAERFGPKRRNMQKRNVIANLTVTLGFSWAATVGYSQAVYNAVQNPQTTRSAIIEIGTTGIVAEHTNSQTISSFSDASIAIQDKNVAPIEDKNVVQNSGKNVVLEQPEKEPFLHFYSEFGYESEYNFRGTDLTVGADGAIFGDLEVSKWGFTLGVYDVYQLGTARFPSFSAGEGGGGGTGGADFAVGKFSPETVQTDFNETDLFLQYHHDFGPLEVTVGDIGFLIQRTAQTFLTTQFEKDGFGPSNPFPTVGDEQFDRLFVRLATSVIPHVQPWITYYQTIYNDGEDHRFYMAPSGATFGTPLNDNFHERNDELGGYLEGRIRGNFQICKWMDVNPFWIISYSFHDRTEPVFIAGPVDPHTFKEILNGRSLVGWNHTQVGVEVPIHLLRFAGPSTTGQAEQGLRLNLVPFGDYSYHISTPPLGTDRNEWWGGVKLTLNF